MSATRRTLVVGAGISGLAAAILLRRAQPSWEVEVWEQQSRAGGLLAPVDFCGVPCDRGSHRVHPQADPLLLELTQEQDWQQRERRGQLLLNGRQLSYPPKIIPFLRGLGGQATWAMGLGFLTRPQALRRFVQWERDRSDAAGEDIGFEQFVTARVGGAAYRSFYAPYVEKVWGLSPDEISQTVAKQRVSISSPMQIFARALGQRKQGFLYPTQGMSSLIDLLRQKALGLGVQFRFGQKLDAAGIANIDADACLFSGHLSDIAPSHQLEHRGLYLLHLTFPKGTLKAVDTFYSPGPENWFGRVSQLEHFSPALRPQHKSILCLEIPEGRWGQGQDFLTRLDAIQQQLVEAGTLPPRTPILDAKQTWIPRVYPLYRRGWFSRWRQAIDEVESLERVWPIGRQGLYLHCNMDHCVRIAHDAVEALSLGRPASAWLRQAQSYLDLRVRD